VHLVGLSEAVNASHLALLVGIAEDAGGMSVTGCDAVNKVLATVLSYVLAQLGQQPRRPLLLRVRLLRLSFQPQT